MIIRIPREEFKMNEVVYVVLSPDRGAGAWVHEVFATEAQAEEYIRNNPDETFEIQDAPFHR